MLEQLADYAGRGQGPTGCKMQRIIDNLDQADRDILLAALDSESEFSTNGLFKGLTRLGIDVGYQTVYRHRTKTCPCGRGNA